MSNPLLEAQLAVIAADGVRKARVVSVSNALTSAKAAGTFDEMRLGIGVAEERLSELINLYGELNFPPFPRPPGLEG